MNLRISTPTPFLTKKYSQPLYHTITIEPGSYNQHFLTFFQTGRGFPNTETNLDGGGGCLTPGVDYQVNSLYLTMNSGNQRDFEKLIQNSHFRFMSACSTFIEGPGKLFLLADTKELYSTLTKAIKNPQKARKDLVEVLGKYFDRNYKGYLFEIPVILESLMYFRVELRTNSETVEIKKPLKIMCVFEGTMTRRMC